MTTSRTQTTRRLGRRHQAAAVLAFAALALTACGSGDGDNEEPTAADSASPSVAATDEPTAGESPSADPTTGVETGTADDPIVYGPDGVTIVDDPNYVTLADPPRPAQEDVFSALSPWNQEVFDARVHPNSDGLLDLARVRIGRDQDGRLVRTRVNEGVYVNTTAWTVPVVADGVSTIFSCRQELCGDGQGEDIVLDVPENVDPATIYDGWFTVFDEDEQIGYDFWRARREDDGTISYHFVRTWDLDGPGFSQPYIVAARGSGLPLFGGLIRPGELERCQINHALAISVPAPAAGNFIQPASATDGNGFEHSLPEGARIRLRSDFLLTRAIDPLTGEPYPATRRQIRHADCIVRALKRYGAIVVDRAAVPTLYFQRLDSQREENLLHGYELQSIGLDDFDVMYFNRDDRLPWPARDEDVDSTELETNNLETSGDQ